MTRRDYVLLAASIAQAKQATEIERNAAKRTAGVKAISLTAIGLASALANDNPAFDRTRFLTACGL